jgi:hypothetical protein
MIQLSFALPGRPPASVPAPPAPLRVADHPDGLRLTGVWSHRDLAAARAEVVAWLVRADATEAVDLFTGRPMTLAELSAPPTVANLFQARHTTLEGRIWARLFGCYALGESDVVASVDPDVPIEALYRLLSHYATFRLADLADGGGDRRRDRPIPYGYWFLGLADADVADQDFWAMLRDGLHSRHLRSAFDDRMATPSPVFLMEAASVAGEITGWQLGVTRAASLEDLHLRTARRWGASGGIATPSAHDAAGACDRALAASAGADRFAYRELPGGGGGQPNDLDSGWRLACDDPDHRHDRDSFRIVPLHQAVAAAPELLPYLGLPAGSVVLREAGALWVQPPGHERAWREEEPDTEALTEAAS